MSYDLLGWMGAVDGGLSDGEFRVLFRLCWHANQKTGEIYPSIETIGQSTGMHPRTVMRHVKQLEDKRYIEVERGRWANGTQKVNRYVILADITYRMPDDREVTVKVKMPPKNPGDKSVTWTDEPGDKSVAHRVTVLSPIEEGRVKKEVPPLPTGEDTPAGNLFGETLPAIQQPDLVDQVFNAWRELAKEIPGITSIDVLNDSRRKKIAARGKEGKTNDRTAWEAWEQVFRNIRASTYLCGEDPPGRGYTDPFALSIEFVLRPSEFLRILDGGYRANRSDLTHSPDTGRRFGPSEQAGRAAIARIRANEDQRADGRDGGGGAQAPGSTDAGSRPLRSAFDQYRVDDAGRG